MCLSPPSESETGRLQMGFPRSLYFTPFLQKGWTPQEPVCQTQAVHVEAGTESWSGEVRTPKIAPDCNALKSCVQQLWQDQDQNAKFFWIQKGNGKIHGRKILLRVGSSRHHLWLRKIPSHVATDARKEFRGNITICFFVLMSFWSIYSWCFQDTGVWVRWILGLTLVLHDVITVCDLNLSPFSLEFCNMHPFYI